MSMELGLEIVEFSVTSCILSSYNLVRASLCSAREIHEQCKNLGKSIINACKPAGKG